MPEGDVQEDDEREDADGDRGEFVSRGCQKHDDRGQHDEDKDDLHGIRRQILVWVRADGAPATEPAESRRDCASEAPLYPLGAVKGSRR